MSVPPATLWEQYSVIGILVLILLFLSLVVERAWRAWTAWRADEFARQMQRDAEQENARRLEVEEQRRREAIQDAQRKAEREEQRQWQAEQNEKLERNLRERDQAWRDFLAVQQDKSTRSDLELQKQMAKHTDELIRNTASIDDLRLSMVKHDTFARQVLSEESRERLRLAAGTVTPSAATRSTE